MLPRGHAFLSSVSIARLRAMARVEKNRKAQLRLLAAIHRKEGKKEEMIASTLQQPLTTIHNWLQRLHEGGLGRRTDKKQSGRPPRLTVAQRRRLMRALARGPPHNKSGLWTTKEVRELIKRDFGTEYVSQHAWRVLVACGFSLQRPRQRHYKSASPDDISRFKKKQNVKQDTIERKDLLWARKTKQPSDSSRSLRAAGRARVADQLSP